MAKTPSGRYTNHALRLLLFLLCLSLFSLVSAHPANVASAQAKVKPDGTLTTRVRFDLTAFVTGLPPKEADDRAMNAFLDGSDEAMRSALADAEARFRAEFRFGGTIDRLAFPTVADVRAFLAADPKPRLPAMLTATVEGHLPQGTRILAFRYPSALGTIIQTVEFPYEEPISEPVEPGGPSATLTIPTADQVAKLAAAMNAPRAEPKPPKRVPLAAARKVTPLSSGRVRREEGRKEEESSVPWRPFSGGEGPGVRGDEPKAPETDRRPPPPTVSEKVAVVPHYSKERAAQEEAPVRPAARSKAPSPASRPPYALQTLPSEAAPTKNQKPTGANVLPYLRMGFTHILPEGLDHILFVLGLFLLGSNTKALLKQVTAFTVAHSITLALATLDLVRLPGRIIEPLIAVSIAFVAIENLVSKEVHRWRTAVVFGFGLVHGMGFAEVFRDAGLSGRGLVAALLSFNVGVELGQLSVIAMALLAVGWFRSDPRYRPRVVVPCSLLIALVALFWTAQRIVS